MRVLVWLARALAFFTLFAFALNNQQPAELRWFFGYAWEAPMVLVVLCAFVTGCLLTGLMMLPAWWKLRQFQRKEDATMAALSETPQTSGARKTEAPLMEPPRDVL
jgi:uncharacterized integral membrane protein